MSKERLSRLQRWVLRKKGLLTAGLLLFLSASILARAPSSFPGKMERPGQSERPKFYALLVVSEKNVQNAKDSLGAPDGGYTEILPGGQLVLLMEKNFIDGGTVVCKGEEDYGLEAWVQMQDTQDEQQNYAWMIIQREPSNRFIFLGGDPNSGMGGYWGMAVNTVRITNFGTKSLFVDAVIGYGMEAEVRRQRRGDTWQLGRNRKSLRLFTGSYTSSRSSRIRNSRRPQGD